MSIEVLPVKGFSNGTALTDIELDELQRNRRIRVRRDDYGGTKTFPLSYNSGTDIKAPVSGFILLQLTLFIKTYL